MQNHPDKSVVGVRRVGADSPIDWSAPGTSVLDRLHDRRVRQFWDSGHLVAAIIKKAETTGQLHPDCCERNGLLWDLTAAYAPGARWSDNLSEPIFLNGR